ncbi:unnamed protein product [Strongylus vulgaris]|uniref:Transcription initiation factor TFIID subunit 6 n=1 Tax=Strongylus vulgaris TaxID=40348 RepID=A0A3P7IEG0_STRVU|nr:unnamed protein product [Strongylus vulgaris]
MAAPSASTSSFAQSCPPRIEPQYVRIVGDSVGVVNLTPAALQCLADKLTQCLIRCSMAARQLAVHGRRRTVRVEDLELALRSYGLQMPIGALTRSLPSIRQLHMPGGEQLYVREDADLDVPALTQPPLVKVPVKRHIRVHWIRVDSEEEPPPEKKAKKISQGSGITSADLPAALRKRRVFCNYSAAPSISYRLAAQGVPRKEQILIKPSFVEPLSVEQQVYLKEIVEACVGQDDRKRQQALQSLERDTGIQVLLPRLSRLIYTSVSSKLSCTL